MSTMLKPEPTALVVPETPTESQIKTSATALVAEALNLKIFTRSDLSYATDLVKTIKDRARAAEDERTRIVGPFNQGVKHINGRFKVITQPLEDAEVALKAKMLAFQRDEQRKAEEERQRLQREQTQRENEERERNREKDVERVAIATEGEEQDRATPPPIEVAPVEIASKFKPVTYGQTGAASTVRKVWASEIVDITLIPKEFIVADQVKINQAVRAGIREIPGVRIFQKEEMVIK